MDNENIAIENEMLIILDKNKRPLGFVSEKRAQQLLRDGKAVVHSIKPFVIRHKTKDARTCTKFEYKIKIDPGSKETGISVIDLDNNVYMKIIIVHRGQVVVGNIKTRHDSRRNRRNRETRYRRCKYKDGGKFKSKRSEGWLPPSVISIEQNIINWVNKLCKLVNIVECSVETVCFDIQKMNNPDIQGAEYQYDTKEGQTLRTYLLEATGHTCQYCGGKSKDTHLEVEHKISKKNGGSGKLKNLTIACHKCNQDKSNLNLDTWLEELKQSDKELDIERTKHVEKVLKGQINKLERYAAWVNSYRTRLVKDLEKFNFRKLEQSDGVTTKMNRIKHGLSKKHYNDAACVGETPDKFKQYTSVAHVITATGRGTRLKGSVNSCGILKHDNVHREKTCHGFQTGDIVKINKPKGTCSGKFVKRISIRHSGTFDFRHNGKRECVSYKHCTILQRNNGYDFKTVHTL